jgi:hypothetical protein
VRIEWDKSLYPPDGRIKVYNISTYGNTGAYQYLNVPNNSFDVRIENPINFGSKNLVEYYVPWTNGQLTPGSPFVRVGGKRLFSAPDVYTPVPVGALNMGITAGDYIEISGSSYNDGVYQVLSKRDGITNILGSNITYQPLGDLEFNVRLSYSDASDQPIIQYLELSRDIVPEPSAPGKNITIRKVTGKPVLHIKYRVKN